MKNTISNAPASHAASVTPGAAKLDPRQGGSMERRSMGASLKSKTLGLMVAFVLAFAGLCAMPLVANAGVGDTPAHSKTSTDNGDGTYKLELSVTGDADTTVQKAANVNVLIVYDVSQSMTSTVSGGRSRADFAETIVHNFVEDLAGYQKEDDPSTEDVDESDNIQVALVTFGPRATQRSGWTSDLSSTGINQYFNGEEGGTTASHNYSQNLGTNWDHALSLAETLVQDADSDPTFVIFVTDGVCTAQGSSASQGDAPTNENWTNYRGYYNAATDSAFAIANREKTTLFGIYAYGTEHDLLDDLMYYAYHPNTAGNAGTHRSMTVGSTTYDLMSVPTNQYGTYPFGDTDTNEATNYYNASDTAALTEAIEDIFDTIVKALGVSSATISDGTTNEVATSTGVAELLEVDETSYQYWLSIPIDSNNQFTRIDGTSGEEVVYTVSSDGKTVTWKEGTQNKSVTVNGTITEDGQLKYEWKEANDLYDKAPPAAKLTDGSVDWNLSSVETLLNGVTYSVTFDVYPSQTTLDIVADIKNDPSSYNDLDENIKKYIDSEGKLKTNTTATLKWTDTRETTPTEHSVDYRNPDPVENSAVEQMALSKLWDNKLEDEWDKPDSLVLGVTRDGEEHYTLTLTDPSWAGTVYISIGIMGSDGKPLSGSAGHDFTFTEPEIQGEDFKWEIDAPTVHPMLINNVKTMLIKVDAKHPAPEGAKTYSFNNATYYVGDETVALTATNERRSSLNLVKKVTGDNAPADATFPFTVNVVDSLAPESAPSATEDPGHDSDWWIWISVWDKDQQDVTEGAVVSGATYASGSWYYGESGKDIKLNVKDGYSIRFNNLPTGSTYTITEGDLPAGFSFDEAAIEFTEGAQPTPDWTFSGGPTSTGKIDTTNAVYTVTYTNTYESGELDITKTVTGPEGFTPDPSKKFTFNVTLEKAGEGEEAESEAVTGKFKYTVGTSTTEQTLEVTENGGTLQLAGGETAKIVGIPVGVTYTVTEDEESIPAGYENTASSGTTGTISATAIATAAFTNTYSAEPATVSFPVKKVMDVPEDLDGPATWSYTINVVANGQAPEAETMTGTVSNTTDTVTFGPFGPFTAPGEYTYTVSETGEIDGVTNDEDADGKTVTVTVEDNGEGALTATADSTEASPLTFTNTYGAEPAEVEIDVVEKLVEYFPLAYLYDEEAGTGQFTFQVKDKDKDDKVVSTGTNGADGTVAFTPALKFEAPGTYEFTIVEVDDEQSGIGYDTTEFALTVTVTDKGDGTLAATPKYEDEPVFKNTYEATGETTITALKKLLSKLTDKQLELEGGEFTFTIEGSEGAPMPEKDEATNDANGQVDFGTVTFDVSEIPDEAWTYVKEPEEEAEGNEADKDAEGEESDEQEPAPAMKSVAGEGTVDEAAADEGEADGEEAEGEEAEGEAESDAEDPEPEALLESVQIVDPDPEPAVEPAFLKAIEIAEAAEPEIEAMNDTPDSVIVVDDKAAPAGEADGAVAVKAAEGESSALRYITFQYTISEVAGDDPHIEYAGAESDAIIIVTVEDDGKGNLTVTKEYEGNEGEFVNYYTPDPVIVDPPVQKVIEGNDDLYNGGDFTFVIAGPEDGPMPENNTITNSPEYEKDGKAGYYEFGEIEFTAPGEYTYTVTESGNVENVTNDPESEKSFTFTVTEDEKGNLVVSPDTYDACWIFTNVYKEPPSNPAIKVEKTVTSSPKNGEYYELDETIEYEIVVTNTGDVDLHDVTVKDDLTSSEWKLEALAVSESKTYTTTYKVTEADVTAGKVLNQATAEGYSPKDEKVTDDDDAEAKTGKKPEIPVTGDNLPVVALVVVAMAAAGTGIVAVRRRAAAAEAERSGAHARPTRRR